jgi:hypothetical protein
MRDSLIRGGGLALAILYGGFLGWLYANQPQTLAEVTGGLASSVGVYRIDEVAFADGLRFFRNDQFVEARAAFTRADPAVRDPQVQFYIAYTFYRQGWGRTHNDDALFAAGLEAVKRAIDLAPAGRLVVEDSNLMMRSADELKAELEAGLITDASDFNPARLLRPRK